MTATGAVTRTWTAVTTTWGMVEEDEPSERVRNGRIDARQTVTVTLRQRDSLGVQPGDRLVIEGRRYEVSGYPVGHPRAAYRVIIATEQDET